MAVDVMHSPALAKIYQRKPQIGIVLGSGLAGFAERLAQKEEFPFAEVEGMQPATAPGHQGKMVVGTCAGKVVLVMQGRLHGYEGHAIEDVVYPVRLMHALGVRTLILSNASGGIHLGFQPGDLMLITDHINFMGINPLVGAVQSNETRFPDMSYAYDPDLGALMKKAANSCQMALREGVYIGCSGPSYETPAEIRAFRKWGADAVGMSTVPEVIVANALGMQVVAVSCISNMAAGILPQRLTEEEVLETGRRVTDSFVQLIERFVDLLEV